MNLQRLRIQNFKSLVDLEIINPNPFTVFVGPNAAGKSNIFEALEFLNYTIMGSPTLKIFDEKTIRNINDDQNKISFAGTISDEGFSIVSENINVVVSENILSFLTQNKSENPNLNNFINGFSRIFIKNAELEKFNYKNDKRLSISAKNLEQVLKRILKEENTKEEFLEWIQLFIPEFENIEIHTDSISGDDNFLIYEKHSKNPFKKSLISDGTYNILALLTAVFQSDEPQFLCIEEPENGLNPYVVKELVHFFRTACKEKGHYIWLNTHSQTLISQLKPEELIIVEKIKGATQIKQLQGFDLHGLSLDEAWLSGALGGGTPW